MKNLIILIAITLLISSCSENKNARKPEKQVTTEIKSTTNSELMGKKLNEYVRVPLTTDLSKLTDKEKKMIPLLIKAAQTMDELFWYEAYGDKNALLNSIKDKNTRDFIKLNYSPWDRLDNNTPIISSVKKKRLGANFYPKNMTKEEFEKSTLVDKDSLYTFIERNDKGELIAIGYNQKFNKQLRKTSQYLLEAAEFAENKGLKKYLLARSKALLNDDYLQSDNLWMDMKTNHLDIVIGPIETYEDQLFGYKAAHEAYVLVKDMEWSKKLAHFVTFLPELQKNLPVDAKYKAEKPGTKSDLNAYDAIYYSGESNSGGKTIAINLPNDERVQLKKGTRRLQLKNVMKAKFDKILVPIANELITPEQRKFITFDAFFANTMFHEVAHGLGIKNTINGKGSVRTSLKNLSSALEEGKADVLGLYMVMQLHKKGELDGDMKDYMTTFMASIFRSIRFGAASAHGRANMLRFNYFKEKEAFIRNDNGTYTLNYDKITKAMNDLSALILKLQGDGDYDAVEKLMKEKGSISHQLQKDLDRLVEKNIPVDITFEQGVKVLGL
ncbi:MAG TPA: Zn-dependent hydrolase [Flavobacteriaceae bacterium]|nr:Zn-dependent hydrolase [Flavobacteriaceae bacterium]